MNRPFIYLLVTIILGFAISCEPCEDCGPQDAYPYFKLTVLNKTSLDTLNADNTRLKADLTKIKNALNDPELASKTDSLNNLESIVEDSLVILSDLIRITKARLISIESINGTRDLFKDNLGGDSLVNFKIPLDTHDTLSTYLIKFEESDLIYLLSLTYQLKDTVLEDRITQSAFDLDIDFSDFDSTSNPRGCQKQNCISNDLTVYVEI